MVDGPVERGAVGTSLATGNDFLKHGACLHCASVIVETEIWQEHFLAVTKVIKDSEQAKFSRLPVVSHGAEHLVKNKIPLLLRSAESHRWTGSL